MIESYKNELVRQKAELRSMPKGNLILRKGITKNEILLQKMARKKYLEISTRLLEDEIANLNQYLRKRVEPSPENVLALLPEYCKVLPEKNLNS